MRFFGNVNVGAAPINTSLDVTHLPLSSLLPHYSHLLLANGCPTPRVHPALSLPSSVCRPALDIVHWYTSHPASPGPPDLSKSEHVTVIGHGNVALDVARILLSHPSRLEPYDVPNAVLDVLRASRVKHVSIVGRRGPLQASFAPRELREMMSLDDVAFMPLPQDVMERAESEIKAIETAAKVEPQVAGGETLGIGAGVSRAQKRMFGMLKGGSKAHFGSTPKTFSIEFFKSPVGLEYSPSGPRAVSLKLSHTTLDSPGASARAIPTGEFSTIDTDLVLPSLGYIPDSSAAGWIATPSLSHVRNNSGRIVDAEGHVIRNAYVSGWAASGAKGVLARTVEDARLASSIIVEDFMMAGSENSAGDTKHTNLLNASPDIPLDSIPPEVQSSLERGVVTTYKDWERVNTEEIKRGQETIITGDVRKERERMDWSSAKVFLDGMRGRLAYADDTAL